MKVSISHDKGKQEAMRIVDQSTEELFTGVQIAPLRIVRKEKSWKGSVMTFAFVGQVGFLQAPLNGTVEVTEKEIIVECELPGILKKFLPEEKIKAGLETRVRGLLKG